MLLVALFTLKAKTLSATVGGWVQFTSRKPTLRCSMRHNISFKHPVPLWMYCTYLEACLDPSTDCGSAVFET